MAEMTKQYLLEIQFPNDKKEGRWKYGAYFDRGGNARFYPTLEEAKAGLGRLLRKFNKDFEYGPDGRRRETTDCGGGIAADLTADKDMDDASRIVAWRIRAREVTPWWAVLENS